MEHYAMMPPLPIPVEKDLFTGRELYTREQMLEFALAAMRQQKWEDSLEMREMQERLEDPFNG